MGQWRLICLSELRKVLGAWGLETGRRAILGKVTAADVWLLEVCPPTQVSLSDKKKVSLVIASFLVQAPYLNSFR